VAVKRLYKGKHREGVNVAAVCEVQVLQEMNHRNVVKVSEGSSLLQSPASDTDALRVSCSTSSL